VFAMSLDLLMGRAGMVSFGHSAFFGVGGYAAALLLPRSPGLVAGLAVPAAAAALAALVIGALSIRVGGVYFIMLTLALSPMFCGVTFQASWLGAGDGIVGVPRPAPLGLPLAGPMAFHLYLVAAAGLGALALARIARSPFGDVLRGIRDNEGRMEALGYPVRRYKVLAFVAAGAVAGMAGALYTALAGSITPDAFLWTTSGEALLMVIIGGTGTLGGAVLGAAAFI